MRRLPLILFGWCLQVAATGALAGVVVVAHPDVRKLDLTTVQRIYTGKVVELSGQRVSPVNLAAGHPLRQRFLADFLQSDEPRYQAYWTVRRYVGKGVPPREFANSSEVIAHVLVTPGGIAYVDEADVPAGVNVVARPGRQTGGSP